MADHAGRAVTAGVVELVHGALVLRGQSAWQHRHLDRKLLELGQGRGIDLPPFPRDLHQRFGEIAIEGVRFAADRLIAAAQDAAEVIKTDQIAKGLIDSGSEPALDKRSDRGLDLVASQL